MTVRVWLASIAGGAALLLAAAGLAPHFGALGLTAYLLAYLLVSTTILAAAGTAPELGPRALAWLALPGAALTGLALAGPAAVSLWGAAAVLALLLFAGTLAGAVLGGRIEAPGHLIMVAVASSLANLYSVLSPAGPSRAAIAAPRVLSVLALPWPIFGTRELAPMIGVGDVVFAAVYLAVARKHGLPVRRIGLALAAALVAALALVIELERPIPILPLMGAAVLLVEPRARHLPRKDRAPALVGALLLGGVFAFLMLR